VLSYEALADGLTTDQLIEKILRAVPVPDKPLDSHVRLS
jgi:MoxR-like ATPase